MSRFYLRGLGWLVAAMVAATGTVVTPAYATENNTDLATGTVAGHFTDRAGNGVLATVQVYDDLGTRVQGSTDASGAFSLTVPSGSYLLSFSYGGARQWAYGTFIERAAANIRVVAGQVTTVNDVKLPTGTITGTVTNPDGSPASNLQVRVEGNNFFPRYGYTDESGRYLIGDLPPDTYKVAFELPGGSRQYAHQATTPAQAETFTVAGDTVTTVDEQLLPTGALAGRFTDADGNGMAGITVYAYRSYPSSYVSTTTDATGAYRFDRVFSGSYRVRFHEEQVRLDQFAFGRTTAEAADPITVGADQTVVVNDSRLPTGSIRVTARDGVTGAAISTFQAVTSQRGMITTDGAAILPYLLPGSYPVSVTADGYVSNANAATVTVVAGQQTDVRVTLQPVGRIATRVIDRATGAPVADVCVFAVRPQDFTLPSGCVRTDATGTATMVPDELGSYQLFVLPDTGSPYGAQWVGPQGGTGTQSSAARITVQAGRTASPPKVKLDPPGEISGRVTSPTGQPLRRGRVGIFGPSTSSGGIDLPYSPIAEDGSYIVGWLGPYGWPLLFRADDHAYQWSGGGWSRQRADLVPVRAGRTTNYNYRLKQGADLVVTGSEADRALLARNSETGEPVGATDSELGRSETHLRILGPQRVKLTGPGDPEIWYGGTDFASATPIRIPATGTVGITLGAD